MGDLLRAADLVVGDSTGWLLLRHVRLHQRRDHLADVLIVVSPVRGGRPHFPRRTTGDLLHQISERR